MISPMFSLPFRLPDLLKAVIYSTLLPGNPSAEMIDLVILQKYCPLYRISAIAHTYCVDCPVHAAQFLMICSLVVEEGKLTAAILL